MASSIAGTPLFKHIKYLMLTTVPSFALTLIIFLILGFLHTGHDATQITVYTETLASKFNISLWTLVVPVITGIMIARKMPALTVLGISTVLAAVFAIILQPHIINEIGVNALESMGLNGKGGQAGALFTGIVKTIYDSVSVSTGVAEVDKLVSSRGMLGMLNTVYLVISAMCFGGCMKASGMLHHLASLILPMTKTRTGLVASTVGTGVILNGVISDQYLAIILTSDIYKDIYAKRGYESRLLGRSVEDSATVTSPLYPWSSCGMTQATILGVPTLAYFPFCFFNIISPVMSIIMAITGYKIFRRDAAPKED